jgi:hypothetical protein
MLYRGQKYGDPVGEWWTTSRDEALKFAMSRGGNRTYVVLALDEDLDESWLKPLKTYDRAGRRQHLRARRDRRIHPGDSRGDWYYIPFLTLRKHWRGVKIIDGSISVEDPVLADDDSPTPTKGEPAGVLSTPKLS